MSLLITMLPLYLFGNLHCIGMCGPLVMMIGAHRYRYFYFMGRILSFTLAATFAGYAGAVLHLILAQYHLSALASLMFGGIILILGIYTLFNQHFPGYRFIAHHTRGVNQTLSILMLQDRAWPSFLFGFFTVMLPCGQTLVVFSACALAADPWVGMLNGFVFALLTTPSLVVAMHARSLIQRFRHHYNLLVGIVSIVVGMLALCRGFAELEWIPHAVLSSEYHIVLY
jgi:uncharacterized protein